MENAPLLNQVKARMNYLGDMTEKPYSRIGELLPGEERRNGSEDWREVTIKDARLLIGHLSLDREGFELRQDLAPSGDLYDETWVEKSYLPAMERLVAEVTGAKRVIAFDQTVRTAALKRPDGRPTREPVPRVHNDYTEKSAPQRVRDLLPDEAEAMLKKRYAFINVWRPIAEPLLHLPLAFCDARSLGPDDLVAADLLYRNRVGETYAVRYNAKHRWYYFSAMKRSEVALLKVFDSDKSRARLAVHSAFDDPTTPADAPPRASIEVRTIAFFD